METVNLTNQSLATLSAVNMSSNQPASEAAIVLVSLLFFAIEVVGLLGNLLIIYVILVDPKMRRSATNLFIMNLAISDFIILAIGVPEIVQFMLNRGWLLGLVSCKMHRYLMVAALYSSITSLTAVCVERYIAIVHPIKAHILCSRRRILCAISLIWPASLLVAMHVPVFNNLVSPPGVPVELCLQAFPFNQKLSSTVVRAGEFLLFFMIPITSQVVLYSIVSRRLFAGSKKLHRKQTVRCDGVDKEKDAEAIRARKGVVKMLIATVTVYFLSYAPVQVPLFYNLISATPFKANWSYHAFLMTLANVNSAANPILYAIFSQNFRRRFQRVLCSCRDTKRPSRRRTMSTTTDSYASKMTRFTSMRVMSSVSEI